MINPLKIATGGYLKRTTKVALVIAVSGYLNYGQPITEIPVGGFGGGEVTYGAVWDNEREKRIINDDAEIIAIVEMCLKITTL